MFGDTVSYMKPRAKVSMVAVIFFVALIMPCAAAESAATAGAAEVHEADVVIYGGTSSGIIAAIKAKRLGKSVVLVSPDKLLGGMTTGGLGWTDNGNKAVIGGLAREFYHRIWKHYEDPVAWRWQARANFRNQGQGSSAVDANNQTMWIFEPHAAEKVFEDWLFEEQVPVVRNVWLNRETGVEKGGPRIVSMTTLDAQTFRGKIFIDATYEGDLMAAAGVSYTIGRESQSKYGEKWNGVQVGVLHHGHYFKKPVDPYIVPGDAKSGLLPRISSKPPGEFGSGDNRVQAYCYRMCLTDVAENRLPFSKPEGYDPKQYELLLRVFEAGWRETFNKFDSLPNRKTDVNNHGPFSTDNIGYNYDYPDGSYERRRQIIEDHKLYQQGLMYFLANDPRVPDDVRIKMSKWGLAKDEFVDTDNWPHQLYIREARRMVSEHVMTEQNVLNTAPVSDSVGMGSYTIDSHNVQRYVTPEGHVQNEGDIGVAAKAPYAISYRSLVPKQTECDNLFVPVCLSSSHIAYGSIRMEPVLMILGESSAIAGSIAIDEGIPVQKVDYPTCRKRLISAGQVVESQRAAPANK
jgi:hypothetical protein